MLTCPSFASAQPPAHPSATKVGGPPQSDELVGQVQAWIERVEEFPDPSARDLLHECLQSVLALYGEGLGRILELADADGSDGLKLMDRFLDDKLIRGLLLIHGLHPDDVATRVRAALDKVRPYLQTHGGNVELVSLENDVARLRLLGACKGCPSSTLTMQSAIRAALEEACPDLAGLELEDEPKQPCA